MTPRVTGPRGTGNMRSGGPAHATSSCANFSSGCPTPPRDPQFGPGDALESRLLPRNGREPRGWSLSMKCGGNRYVRGAAVSRGTLRGVREIARSREPASGGGDNGSGVVERERGSHPFVEHDQRAGVSVARGRFPYYGDVKATLGAAPWRSTTAIASSSSRGAGSFGPGRRAPPLRGG